jgi:5-methylcytosine-specific restriction endonuclease McrA
MTKEYRIWSGILQSGKMCERWRNFNVGRQPAQGMKLCQIDTSRAYEPNNVHWATAEWMARNRKSAVAITCDGETRNICEWSEISGINSEVIRGRIKAGWVPKDAIYASPSISDGLKRSHAEGRARGRRPVYTPDEMKERKRAQRRVVYIRDREKKLNAQRAYFAAHPERKRAISQRYIDRHRISLNAKAREKRKTPEHKMFMATYMRKHRADNPALYVTYAENRRARKLNAPGSHTKEEWLAKVKACGGRCVYCGSQDRLVRDHDIPLSRNGSNNISNIVPACRRCNSSKHDLTGAEYRARLDGKGTATK